MVDNLISHHQIIDNSDIYHSSIMKCPTASKLSSLLQTDFDSMPTDKDAFYNESYLNIPIDLRNYLISPPPNKTCEWKPKIEDPPVDSSIEHILASETPHLLKSKTGIEIDGVTYISHDESSSLSNSFCSADGGNSVDKLPRIVIHLCSD
jgi:hypothetical protein